MTIDSVSELEAKSDGNQSFLRAARNGNVEKVLEYINAGTEINASNQNGLNALHLASKEGHLQVVQELLNRGAEVDAATKKGNTALHIASLAGQYEVVNLLLEVGAKVNCQSGNGFTPLYMASQENHLEVVKLLLRNGAQQSLTTDDGFTPLAVALQQNNERVVAVLLENDTKGKIRLPALHISAKKDDVKSASVLLNSNIDVNQQSASGFTPLHIAAHYGNVSVASLLIEHGAEVNFQAKNNITPLHVAAKWGKLGMVQKLAECNAQIDCKTRDALTPLHCAARSGHAEAVEYLLNANANFSAKTRNGLSPLHMTAQGDHVDAARYLLIKGANVDEITTDLLTPLHVSAHCGNVKMAKLLLDKHCEVNARALNGFTPLHIACKKNRVKVVELLLKYHAAVEATTESGLTPLHVASFMGHMNAVLLLIQHGANPNEPTIRQETALHLATRSNQLEVLRILLRNGAHVDARAREQQTPLHIACRLGNVDIVSVLLANGAQPDCTTKDNYTSVHIAAKEGQVEVLTLLLEKGAKLDLPTKKGFTPLHVAAKYGKSQVTKLLLQKGAAPNAAARNGLTPLHVAAHYNNTAVALLLLEHKADPHVVARNGYTPLFIAAKKNAMDMATHFLEYGAKASAESKNGFTPLHLATQEGHVDMCTLLLRHGASVNHPSLNGLQAMHLAAQEDRVSVAEVLTTAGAVIDARTNAGYTPLHTACHFGMLNMIRFLLARGAVVNVQTQQGFTPLHLAAQQGHLQVVYVLIENGANPNVPNNQGYTAGHIAKKQHYLNIFEILKDITTVESWEIVEETIEVAKPDTMTESHMTDSEDEGDLDNKSEDILLKDMQLDNVDYAGDISPRITHRLKQSRSANDRNEDKSRRENRGTSMVPVDSCRISNSYAMLEEEMKYYTTQLEDSHFDRKDMDSSFRSEHSYHFYDEISKYSRGEDSINETPATDAEIVAMGRFSSVVKEEMTSVKHISAIYAEPNITPNDDPFWKARDNQPIERTPIVSGFLVSFLVDARGGAMRSSRHPGMRIVVPPNAASAPTRVTCRFMRSGKVNRAPQLNDGEGLACRILEMAPVDTKFNSPVLLELPHYASLRGREREIVVLRSDNGDTWKEHSFEATDTAVQEALGKGFGDRFETNEELRERRIFRVLTYEFPAYFALVTRIRQESVLIGSEGGVISSTVVSQVQAVFPENALQKKIRVGLQVHPVTAETVARQLGNRVAVSPIVTIEPRRRKFHKPITLTIPLPRPATRGMTNPGESPTLRLLCSITGGTAPATWEDITGSTPLSYVKDCVSFTTTVSARFWLMDCPNTSESADMAGRLYRESVVVPYMGKFVVFAKRTDTEEAQLRAFCITDDKTEKTLECQMGFQLKAASPDVEVLQDRPQWLEAVGNLVPVMKSGEQINLHFRVFQENRLSFAVRLRESDAEPVGKVAFLREARPTKPTDQPPTKPITTLEVVLPDMEAGKQSRKRLDLHAVRLAADGQGIILMTHSDTISRAELDLYEIAEALIADWLLLARELGLDQVDINGLKEDYRNETERAYAMLLMWKKCHGDNATGNELERGLRCIGREDIVKLCMRNVEIVTEEEERRRAREIIGDDDNHVLPDKDMVRESESMQDSLSSHAGSLPTGREHYLSDDSNGEHGASDSHLVEESPQVASQKLKNSNSIPDINAFEKVADLMAADFARAEESNEEAHTWKPVNSAFQPEEETDEERYKRLSTVVEQSEVYQEEIEKDTEVARSVKDLLCQLESESGDISVENGQAEIDQELGELDKTRDTRDSYSSYHQIASAENEDIHSDLINSFDAVDDGTTSLTLNADTFEKAHSHENFSAAPEREPTDEDVDQLPYEVHRHNLIEAKTQYHHEKVSELQAHPEDGHYESLSVLQLSYNERNLELQSESHYDELLSESHQDKSLELYYEEDHEPNIDYEKSREQEPKDHHYHDKVFESGHEPHQHRLTHSHQFIRGVPQETVEIEEVEEELPDGTILKKRIYKKRIVQEVTERVVTEGCADEMLEFVEKHKFDDKSLLHPSDSEEEEEEREEILEDGTLVRHRVRVRRTRQILSEKRHYHEDGGEAVWLDESSPVKQSSFEQQQQHDELEPHDELAVAHQLVRDALQGALDILQSATEAVDEVANSATSVQSAHDLSGNLEKVQSAPQQTSSGSSSRPSGKTKRKRGNKAREQR